MKKLLFIIIAIAVYTNIRGQQINQSNNRYRSYDVLEKKQVSVKGFDMNGSENRPLTHLQIINKMYNGVDGSWQYVHGQTNNRSVFDLIEKALRENDSEKEKIIYSY